MKTLFLASLVATLMTPIVPAGLHAQDHLAARISEIVRRDSITVLVTDSGLGGLAVCADLDARVRNTGLYRSVRIIFGNALPEANRGYNRMKSVEAKVRVFDAALQGMARTFRPDVILVACNTLSVLIPQTVFADTAQIPVLGIVETGVDMLYERLTADPAAVALIFGTETTIAADTHRKLLMGRGISPSRLITQACPNLAGAIEEDADGEGVAGAIELFAADAKARVADTTAPLVAGLCCTHYGYAAERFRAALTADAGRQPVIVDPNLRMNDVLFPADKPRYAGVPVSTVEVFSRAAIAPEEIDSIGGLVGQVSPATAAALRSFTLNTELFPFDPETE